MSPIEHRDIYQHMYYNAVELKNNLEQCPLDLVQKQLNEMEEYLKLIDEWNYDGNARTQDKRD